MHFSPPFSTAKAPPDGHTPNGIGHNTSVTRRKPTADEATTIVHTAESRATRAALPLRALHSPLHFPTHHAGHQDSRVRGPACCIFAPQPVHAAPPVPRDSPLRRTPLLIYLSSRLSLPPRQSPKRALVRAPTSPHVQRPHLAPRRPPHRARHHRQHRRLQSLHPRPPARAPRRRSASGHHARRQRVRHSPHPRHPFATRCGERIFRPPRRQLAQPRRSRSVGRRFRHCPRLGRHARQDGARHRRQHAAHHLPLDESPHLRRPGHGPRHVCPHRHARQPRPPAPPQPPQPAHPS